MTHSEIAIIKGDGIGADVTDATLAVLDAARNTTGGFSLEYREILAGAGYFADTGVDIEPPAARLLDERDPVANSTPANVTRSSSVRLDCRRFDTTTALKFRRICACAISMVSTPGCARSRHILTRHSVSPMIAPGISTW